MADAPLRIALIGFGHVGRALVKLDTLPGLAITTHGGGPDTTAYDMLADLTAALRGSRTESGAAARRRPR